MTIRKAVITAAAPSQKSLPLQTLVDQDGSTSTALELVANDIIGAGAEEICIVICPGEKENYLRAAGQHAERIVFVEQNQPLGYADALMQARPFVGEESFLHVLGDHLYISRNGNSCCKQLVDTADAKDCAVSAVQPTRENMLPYFGTVGGQHIDHRNDLYEIKKVIEKPTPTLAEQELVVAGLRASYYLCLFGLHVLTPTVMDLLQEKLAGPKGSTVTLSDALNALAKREQYLAMEVEGTRYNLGEKYGILKAQLALALSGKDRDEILTQLLDMTASRPIESAEAQ